MDLQAPHLVLNSISRLHMAPRHHKATLRFNMVTHLRVLPLSKDTHRHTDILTVLRVDPRRIRATPAIILPTTILDPTMSPTWEDRPRCRLTVECQRLMELARTPALIPVKWADQPVSYIVLLVVNLLPFVILVAQILK